MRPKEDMATKTSLILGYMIRKNKNQNYQPTILCTTMQVNEVLSLILDSKFKRTLIKCGVVTKGKIPAE